MQRTVLTYKKQLVSIMQRTVLTYKKQLNSIGSPDGELILQDRIDFGRRKLFLRLIQASFSSLIPNVIAPQNNLFAVTSDGGTTWNTVELPDGIYTIAQINSALQAATSAWWKEASGFYLSWNRSTNKVWITLDSSKLNITGQLGIDLSRSGISSLLGFTNPNTFTTDGTFLADSFARMNWSGDSVSIYVDGLGPLGIGSNGMKDTEIASIPLSTSSVTNEYVFPTAGLVMPLVNLDDRSSLNKLIFRFTGSRLGLNGNPLPLTLLEGAVEVKLELSWL